MSDKPNYWQQKQIKEMLEQITEIQAQYNQRMDEINALIDKLGDEYKDIHTHLATDIKLSDNRNIVARMPSLITEMNERFKDRDKHEKKQDALKQYVGVCERHIVATRNNTLLEELQHLADDVYDKITQDIKLLQTEGVNLQSARVAARRVLDDVTVHRLYTATNEIAQQLRETIKDDLPVKIDYK